MSALGFVFILHNMKPGSTFADIIFVLCSKTDESSINP